MSAPTGDRLQLHIQDARTRLFKFFFEPWVVEIETALKMTYKEFYKAAGAQLLTHDDTLTVLRIAGITSQEFWAIIYSFGKERKADGEPPNYFTD